MAGAGFKDFQAGEVLTAVDVDTYLMQQTVMVFAGTAERGSAIGTASEGMFTYLKDTNALEYYDGSSWTPFSAGGSGGAFSKHFLLMGA
jgi:hypothetical protein